MTLISVVVLELELIGSEVNTYHNQTLILSALMWEYRSIFILRLDSESALLDPIKRSLTVLSLFLTWISVIVLELEQISSERNTYQNQTLILSTLV